jgi:signal transduction histidine kinase
MTPGVAAKALDLFFSTKFPGRGLGLPVARGAVTSAGGFLRLDTAPGRGTTVDLYWPASD